MAQVLSPLNKKDGCNHVDDKGNLQQLESSRIGNGKGVI